MCPHNILSTLLLVVLPVHLYATLLILFFSQGFKVIFACTTMQNPDLSSNVNWTGLGISMTVWYFAGPGLYYARPDSGGTIYITT